MTMPPSKALATYFSDTQMQSKNELTMLCGLSGTTANEA